MLQKTYNTVVSFSHATNADEFEQLLAQLPDVVRRGLADELQKLGDAHRHDTIAKRAYYFEQEGHGVTVWSWNHVYRPHEAGELIFLVVSSTVSLNEAIANDVYARATGRTIDRPWSAVEDESAD